MTGHIVVGVDGSIPSQHALRWALAEAGRCGVEVVAVRAWQLPHVHVPVFVPAIDAALHEDAAGRALHEAVTAVRPAMPVQEVVVCGSAAEVLIGQAKGAGLLVVGDRGTGGFCRLTLGSVASQVVQHAPCPVVVVRAPLFPSAG